MAKFYSQYGRLYSPNESLPPAIIVDIDGTVASKSSMRGYYDWDRVDLDSPRELVISLLSPFIDKNYHVLFLSGRNKICYDKTHKWIVDNIELEYDQFSLYMRKDRIVKEEIFWGEIANNWNVKMAMDDRRVI